MKLNIKIPEGFEIDKDNSDISTGEIAFKKIIKNSYNQVANELFKGKNVFHMDEYGDITEDNCNNEDTHEPNNATSKEQLESLLALNKLANVAKYLNNDWVPVISVVDYCLEYGPNSETVIVRSNTTATLKGNVLFKSKELAEQAINILGKEEIKKALQLNY